MAKIRMFIFDLDGTLTNVPFRDKAPRAVLPGRKEKLAELKAGGAKLAIATNQGGVAFGFTTEQKAREEVRVVMEELDIDFYRIAFGHPKPGWNYQEYGTEEHLRMRKPAPGMLLELIEQAGVKPWETMMIGDMEEDQGAAHAAGCLFCWEKDFFADYPAQLWAIYQQFQALVKATGDESLHLSLSHNGSGSIGLEGYSAWVDWSSMMEAPGLIEQARKDEEEVKETARRKEMEPRKEAAVAKPDDFDPFLDDSDELP